MYYVFLCVLFSIIPSSVYALEELGVRYTSPTRLELSFIPDTIQDTSAITERFVLSPDDISRVAFRIAKRNLQLPGISGIYGIYHGFSAISNTNGRISFPYFDEGDELIVVVTYKVSPVVILGNTVDHVELSPDEPSAWYSLTRERVGNDAYWDVRMIEPPTSGRIPHNALVIAAKPKQVYFKTARFRAPITAQMVLPPLYVSPRITLGLNALQVVKFNKFYRPTQQLLKRTPLSYASLFEHPTR